MNRKHKRTLEAIFRNPVQSGVPWKNIEALLKSLGAEIADGSGSRVRIVLNDVRVFFIGLILGNRQTRELYVICAAF